MDTLPHAERLESGLVRLVLRSGLVVEIEPADARELVSNQELRDSIRWAANGVHENNGATGPLT